MLSLATFHIAHECNQLNHVALPISMPRFKSIIFAKIALKLSYICKKMHSFRTLVAPPSYPQNGPPPLRISGYAPGQYQIETVGVGLIYNYFEIFE